MKATILQVYDGDKFVAYVKEVYSNSIGWYYMTTLNFNKAMVIENTRTFNSIMRHTLEDLDPTKTHLKNLNIRPIERPEYSTILNIKKKWYKNNNI